MVMEIKQRNLLLTSGKRISLKFDEKTWQAIDVLAEKCGQSWREWCAEVIEMIPKGDNITASIRAFAINDLLAEVAFIAPTESMGAYQPIGFRVSSQFWDDNHFRETLAAGSIENGTSDCCSFTVVTGTDEFGRVAYYIENKLKGAPHLIISTPFNQNQWLDALEA